MSKKLLGYRMFNSKSGKPCCIANFLSEYSDSQQRYGAVGSFSQEVFIPDRYFSLFVPSSIGSDFNLTYVPGADGKAYIDEIAPA